MRLLLSLALCRTLSPPRLDARAQPLRSLPGRASTSVRRQRLRLRPPSAPAAATHPPPSAPARAPAARAASEGAPLPRRGRGPAGLRPLLLRRSATEPQRPSPSSGAPRIIRHRLTLRYQTLKLMWMWKMRLRFLMLNPAPCR
ncbi:uncharacterized protein LOC112876304 [Panicum hallii]|uniref:uncharacterized protein LOC112876304 n=1 Tax=Panicum hallii TaxID=206008 RepID=UPI000DF4DBD4|nr:uncharacterized protein LOC112876304 [Panicum hallii]